jgi:DNA-binding NarL/FixJ family response regulator
VRDLRRGSAHELQVVPTVDVRIVPTGLPPVYCHGLRAGLAAAGLTCSLLGTPDELPALLVRGAPVVLTLAAAFAAELRVLPPPPRGEIPSAVQVVHVVPTMTAAACSTALHSGATGVVGLDAEMTEAVDVVRAAAAGRTVLPAPLARALCQSWTGPPPELSPRDQRWLRSMAEGATTASLARAAGYSEREMYRLLATLYVRLGAANRTEALLVAQRHGLLDQEQQ